MVISRCRRLWCFSPSFIICRIAEPTFKLMHGSCPDYVPAMTIRSKSVIAYELYTGVRHVLPKRKGGRKQTNELLSTDAAKRLKNCVELLADAAQTKRLWWPAEKRYVSFKLSFVTLTLPSIQKHEDTYLTGVVLKEFLRWWRRRNPALLYVWKAETQDNGNIHYHLTTNSFIHHEVLRRKWNGLMKHYGYITEEGNQKPPSTEVKAVKNVRDIAAYICAYVSKKDIYQKALKRYHRRYGKRLKALEASKFELPKNYFKRFKRKVTCALWNASEALKIGPLRITEPSMSIMRELDTIAANPLNRKELEYCVVYNRKEVPASLTPSISEAYAAHLASIRKAAKEVIHLME